MKTKKTFGKRFVRNMEDRLWLNWLMTALGIAILILGLFLLPDWISDRTLGWRLTAAIAISISIVAGLCIVLLCYAARERGRYRKARRRWIIARSRVRQHRAWEEKVQKESYQRLLFDAVEYSKVMLQTKVKLKLNEAKED